MLLPEWRIAGVSVTGFAHQADAKRCQDAHAAVITESGWFIGIVSDGAGSAPRAHEGAQIVCADLVTHLATCICTLGAGRGDAALVEERSARIWVECGLEAIRTKLLAMATAAGGSRNDFHATLVGVIANSTGGVFFHVGDGAGCATRLGELSDSVMTKPENGEYAEETYFVTEDNWREHLRLTAFDAQYDVIALMSDGVTPFALTPQAAGPFSPFFEPLSNFLAQHTREEGEQALVSNFEKDAVRRITRDDKTLLWALRIGRND